MAIKHLTLDSLSGGATPQTVEATKGTVREIKGD